MGDLGGLPAALAWAVLVAVAAGDAAPDPPSRLLSEVLTCQPDSPSLSLSLSLDGRALSWFDFPGSRWEPAEPALPPWPPALEPPGEILPESQMCREILGMLSRVLAGKLPEARGLPVISVFPALPPILGQPNTLVCLVQNIFPPVLDLTWVSPAGATSEPSVATSGPLVATDDLTFIRFSRLPIVPRAGDVYACVVSSRRDNATAVTYWVAPDTALDEQLAMALTGAALALALVLAALGAGLILLARRDRNG